MVTSLLFGAPTLVIFSTEQSVCSSLRSTSRICSEPARAPISSSSALIWPDCAEQDGKDYIFCTEADVQRLESENKIIELREYNTIYGIWKYFTVDDGQIDLDKNSYILIGTLETYVKICRYFGNEKVIPIYIEVEDGERLMRAISREKQQKVPKYEEMCRRFLADASDFSDENLKNAGIKRSFINADMQDTLKEIRSYITGELQWQ